MGLRQVEDTYPLGGRAVPDRFGSSIGWRAPANRRRDWVDSGRSSTWEGKDDEWVVHAGANSIARRHVRRSCTRATVSRP
jgi:hypothetical protein